MILGKTAVPEMMLWPFTETVSFGATHNPWDLAYTPGGSSGGSGAALAAGLALPLLALFGYEPGARDPAALQTLTIAYCLLPCVLKLLAGGALYALVIRPEQRAGLVPQTSLPS